jgi:thiosulfate dehydrogenase [quinone] large subunit
MLNLLQRKQERVIEDPKFVTMLFSDARFSVLWLVVRVWLGLQWLEAGWHKVFTEEGTLNAAWVNGGTALQGYWERAVVIPETGRAAITFGWYRDFLQYLLDIEAYTWMGKLIA